MRSWVPENHLSHFILEAVEGFDTSTAKVNHRGSGDAQYPPAMMLALLIYSYSSGVFSSRSIELSTYDSVATRVLDLEVAELMQKAETADSTPLEDGLSVPDEIARREAGKAKLLPGICR